VASDRRSELKPSATTIPCTVSRSISHPRGCAISVPGNPNALLWLTSGLEGHFTSSDIHEQSLRERPDRARLVTYIALLDCMSWRDATLQSGCQRASGNGAFAVWNLRCVDRTCITASRTTMSRSTSICTGDIACRIQPGRTSGIILAVSLQPRWLFRRLPCWPNLVGS